MRLALVHVISAKRESDHASYLFLDVTLVPQLSYRHSREGGIDGLLWQPHELARILLVVLGQGDEKLGLDRRLLHFD